MMIPGKEELSERLLAVTSLIPDSELIVDVGSDHGKLGAFCLRNKRCNKLIATDIHEQPSVRTRKYLEECGFSDQSRVLHTDGLTGCVLTENTTVVIAGMGGLEIRKILESAINSETFPQNTCLILQPQRSWYELRSFLCSFGLLIEDEIISLDRSHFYIVIRCRYTAIPYELSDAQRFFGPCILKNRPKYYNEFMEHQKKVMQKQSLGNPLCKKILQSWEEYT